MSNSMVWRLIRKDLYLYRWLIGSSLVVGGVSLFIPGLSDAALATNVGLILLLTSVVALGIFVAIYGILTERKEKSLLFVLSLPISHDAVHDRQSRGRAHRIPDSLARSLRERSSC